MHDTTPAKTADHAAIPAGADPGIWEHDGGHDYRCLFGISRSIDTRPDVLVWPSAIQLGDGSIDTAPVFEGPAVHVEVGGQPLTVAQARALAAQLLGAADELDGWTGKL